MTDEKTRRLKKPAWLNKRIQYSDERHEVKLVLNTLGLNTVCKSARCPNLSECYLHKRATFLILGNSCTRGCAFCSVRKAPKVEKLPIDESEPERILEAVKRLGIRYVVITSVTRDDLADGGAEQFARCIRSIRSHDPSIKVEVLTPDFKGDTGAIDTVALAEPDVFNHNVETVPRLYGRVRPEADYGRSMEFLRYIRNNYPAIFLKSGFMVGFGEGKREVCDLLRDLFNAGCRAVTIGQYLQPLNGNIPVYEYVSPEAFRNYERDARRIGFKYVASGPYVRSSYMAHEGYDILTKSG
jgi:lipoic acid synthetase